MASSMGRSVINHRRTPEIIIVVLTGWTVCCSSLMVINKKTNHDFGFRGWSQDANLINGINTRERIRLGVTYGTTSTAINMDEKIPSMGFLGCGKIASSIIAGFLHEPNGQLHPDKVITVTSRTKEISTRLTELFPDIVNVVETAQEVVQLSDIVFLCVLPEQVPTVLSQIKLDPQRHTLISLAATCKVDTLVEMSHLPRDRVVKMICLPNVCRREGICLVTPPLDLCVKSSRFWLQRLFTTLGGYLECSSESKMQTLMVITGLMGPMYSILKTNVDWLREHGIPPTEATIFVTRMYQSMIQDAVAAAAATTSVINDSNCHRNEDSASSTNAHTVIDDLIEEQTPGGINEQAYKNLKKLGLDSMYRGTMDSILLRLEKGVAIEGDCTT